MSLDVMLMVDGECVYTNNITHNLGKMAQEANIYRLLWRPEEIAIYKASELVRGLSLGLKDLICNKDKYTKLNPDNGWGCYDDFVLWIADYLAACKGFPDATVEVSR